MPDPAAQPVCLLFKAVIKKTGCTLKAVIFLSLFFPLSFVHSATCPDDSNTATISATSCTVEGSASTFLLQFNAGFTDNTARAAVGGNPGTTVGQQRKRSFIKAASIIAASLNYTVPNGEIIIDAKFSNLSCNASSAVLGSAGATTNTTDVTPGNGVLANTFYPIALLSELNGSNQKSNVGVTSDITADFNSDIGDSDCLSGSNWYYGYDAPPNVNDIGFVTVLLHELTHGLGFASLVNPSNGAKASGIDDIFSNFLFDADNGSWPDLSNAQRAASATSGTKLLWDGTNVNTSAIGNITAGFQDNDSSSSFTTGDRIQMYAPSPVESGSSISHFDKSVTPNELMEPEYTEGQNDLGLALQLLKDIGWNATAVNSAPSLSIPDQMVVENNSKILNLSDFASDADNDTLSYTIDSCATNINCSLMGSSLMLMPTTNHTGDTHTITISVSDGNGGSDTDSFNLQVTEAIEGDLAGTSIADDAQINIDNESVQITLSGGSDSYTVMMTYEGNSASALLDHNSSTNIITIAMPTSGAFAGTYEITVMDSSSNDSISFELIRSPRMIFSSEKLLNNKNDQTLKIEGGEADTAYSLQQQPDSILTFKNDSEQTVSTITAANNASDFNAATATITSQTVNDIFQVDVTATSVYADVTIDDIEVHPSTLHSINVEDSSGNAISNASLALNSNTLLSELKIDTDYESNNIGVIEVLLPDNNTTYSATISAQGFVDQNINLLSGDSPYTVPLIAVSTNDDTGTDSDTNTNTDTNGNSNNDDTNSNGDTGPDENDDSSDQPASIGKSTSTGSFSWLFWVILYLVGLSRMTMRRK